MCKRVFFKLPRVKIQKQVSEVRKKWKTNVGNLDFFLNGEITLRKVSARVAADLFFFWKQPKDAERRVV